MLVGNLGDFLKKKKKKKVGKLFQKEEDWMIPGREKQQVFT